MIAISTPARHGNAIVVALGAFTLAAVMLTTAIDSSVSTARTVANGSDHQRALAALDAVLARREVEVVERASQGDPVEIARWTTNYGVDFVGDAEVRWKIEPVRTPPRDASGNPVHHITNPSPDANWTVPTGSPVDSVTGEPYWQANDTNFMYRIAGEARLGVDSSAPTTVNQGGQTVYRPASVVQGARYASVMKEPLFRYVIFYAARGAKGDLELSHADNVTIQGSVHTNGALYIGSGPKVNDKVARVGPLTGTFAPAFTKVGPDVDGNKVRVNGVDGIFRISKPLMYSIINGFWLYSNYSAGSHGDPNISTGPIAAVKWTATDSYDLVSPSASLPLPLDPPGATFGTIEDATSLGRRVNPYRILDGSGAVTENSFGNSDSLRTINSVALRGVPYASATSGAMVANDSRDTARASDKKWTVLSPQSTAPGFDGKARSKLTGQNVKNLPERMRNRGFEAQRLQYADTDGDDTTDEHEHARPLFVMANGSTTADYPRSALTGFPTFDGNAVVEEPGQYLRYALGDGSYMVRYPTGEGWYVRTRDGTVPADPAMAGLIIRERPTPRADYWPGSDPASVVSPSSSRWLPYAYGKHWYPSTFRFTVADIAEVCAPASADPWGYGSWNDDPLATNRINTTDAARSLSYSPGGRLAFSAAQNASGVGNNFYQGYDNNYRRKPYFYAQNWRFVHLGQHVIDDTQNGLKVTVFNDRPSGVGSQSLVGGPMAVNGAILPLTTPASGIIATPNVANNSTTGIQTTTSSPTSLVSARRSVRFEGFLTASESNLYYVTASVGSSQGVRIWVDGRLAFSNWGVSVNNPQRLTVDRPVPIQIDYCNDNNGSPSLAVYWQKIEPTLGAVVAIPSSAFNPPKANPGIDRSTFTSATVRIDQPFQIPGPNQKKIGLMLRDGSGGMSPILNGGAQYAFIGFSPQRGVFTERRAERHLQDSRTLGTYYIGNGTGPNGAVNTLGEIIDNPDTVAAVNRTASLKQVALTAAVTDAVGHGSETVTSGTTWTTQPVAHLDPLSVDVGGGKIWTILDPFTIGTYVGTRTQYIRKRKQQRIWRVLTVGLDNQVSPFDDVNDTDGWDHNRSMRVYTAGTGTGKYNSDGCDDDRICYDATYATGVLTPPVWSTATGDGTSRERWFLYGAAAGRTQLRRTFDDWSYGNWVNGTTVTQTVTGGSATTVWRGSQLRINKNGTIVTATPADLTTITGRTITAINSGTPNSPWIGPSPVAPTDASCPAVAAAPVSTVPDFVNGGLGRTISIQRSGSTNVFDLNGWISNTGSWLGAAVAQYWPTPGANWTASWAGNTPTTWPLTKSWRPDVHPGTATHSVTAVNPTGDASLQTAGYRLTDDTAIPNTITALWLRVSQSGSTLSFAYSQDGTTWTTLSGTLDISGWGSHLLIGPALQSGDVAITTTASFSDMRITTTQPTPNDVIDATDWDTDASGEDIMGRYLASQYQVWWGNREITEDFFTWTDTATGRRNASEDWIFNTREFWSQSRWWEHRGAGNTLVPKDDEAAPKTTFNNTRLREAYAKTTLLTLDVEAVQSYLRSRLLSEAVADRIAGAQDTPALSGDYTLYQRFSGLIYAARTNRYPWNPNINPWLKENRLAQRDAGGVITGYAGDTSGVNPWSPHWSNQLPNSVADMASATAEIGNSASLSNPACTWLTVAQGHLLQPYIPADVKDDPPLKPQQFHHGVRLVNADSIHWGFDGTRSAVATRAIGTSGTTGIDWRWSSNPQFGVSKTSIVTPNSLYVQGNLNVDRHETARGGDVEQRFTPLAIMGDSVVMLSNAWSDSNAQIAGLSVTNVAGTSSVTGVGTLVTMMTQGTAASDTEYNTAIATHNQPSTRDRVAEGQSAPFVDSMLLLENWNTRTMSYLGSLVVMDSRRYTDAFLHDSYKKYGRTPFGIVDNDSKWLAKFNAFQYERINWDGTTDSFKTGLYGFPATIDWAGHSPAILSEAIRIYQFNYDLLTEEGTPPFAPFGVSTSGVGGWARIIR